MSLQNERAQAREIERLKAYIEKLENALSGQAGECIKLLIQIDAEKKRADAAIADLNYIMCCDTCKKYISAECVNHFDGAGKPDCYEWRGVQEVEG